MSTYTIQRDGDTLIITANEASGRLLTGSYKMVFDCKSILGESITIVLAEDDDSRDFGIPFALLLALSEFFGTTEIDFDVDVYGGGAGCDTCGYGSGPESDREIVIYKATRNNAKAGK